MGTSETLGEGEVLLYSTKEDFEYDTMTIENCGTFKVKPADKGFVRNGVDTSQIMNSLFIIVPDMNTVERMYTEQAMIYQENQSYIHDYFGFDLECSEEKQVEIYKDIYHTIEDSNTAETDFNVECVAAERADFNGLYGGFFFFGILLGLVFICGAVLIMYYKQIIESYEDQSRFEILQKVGMTKKEIRKSINSQILTVFFMPLLTAGLHTAFAFPLVSKMMMLFGVSNDRLLLMVTGGSFLIFAGFYILVYLLTSKAYYGIVSGNTAE